MYSCRKSYADIPFAHRQHLHDGHCALIHGHNWTFTFEFSAERLDATGFVVDFGKLGFVREEIMRLFDHAYVYNAADTVSRRWVEEHGHLVKALEVECCSCEGLARHLLERFDPLVRKASDGRVWISAVEVDEDSRNSAKYVPV